MLFREFHGLPVHIGFNRHEEFVFQFLFDPGFKLLSQFQRCLRPNGTSAGADGSCCRRQTSAPGMRAIHPCGRDASATSLRAAPDGEDPTGRESLTARRSSFRPRAEVAESDADRAGDWAPSQNGEAMPVAMPPKIPPCSRAQTMAQLWVPAQKANPPCCRRGQWSSDISCTSLGRCCPPPPPPLLLSRQRQEFLPPVLPAFRDGGLAFRNFHKIAAVGAAHLH